MSRKKLWGATLAESLVLALALVLFGVGAAPVQAHTGNPCPHNNPSHHHCTGGGGGGGGGGNDRSLTVTLDAIGSSSNVRSDGAGDPVDSYSHSEKRVKVLLGTAQHRPGFKMTLQSGKNERAVTVDFSCSIAAGLPDNCDLLPDVFESAATRSDVILNLRPYDVNCPELLHGDCPDVSTMGLTTQDMSFRLDFFRSPDNLFVEAASAIGGADFPNPGRCLSLLSGDDRDAFLLEQCPSGSESNCNVSVTAFDLGDIGGAGDNDGENDEWDIVANNTVALMCDLLDNVVFGMTTLTFGANAIKE